MVSRNDQYFYLSGAFSFALFTLVVILFSYALMSSDKAKTYALKKDNYIAVSIELPTQKRSPNATNKPDPKPISKPESQPKPTKIPQVTQDVSSLFSNIWTQKVSTKPAKKETMLDSKRLSAIEKRIKTTTSTQSDLASEKIKTLDLARPSVEITGSSSSSASEVNEYFAKIQAIIYEHFYPPSSSEGSIAKIYVRFDARGRLIDYRVLVYSGNEAFDDEVKRLKKRLSGVMFPKAPETQLRSINIDLKAEE